MMINIWVNHESAEVKTETEFAEVVKDRIKEYLEDEAVLSEWLEEKFYPIEIWNMTKEDRQIAEEEFKAHIHYRAMEELDNDGWIKYELNL